MKASEKCLQLVRDCEGFSAKPYRCPAGVWTIGYGSTRWESGKAVAPTDKPIDRTRADALMRHELEKYEASVVAMVRVPINQSQFDALLDFAYNCGQEALRGSTLLRKLNAGDFKGAAAEFGKWVHGGGKVLPGLVTRRLLERSLFEGKS